LLALKLQNWNGRGTTGRKQALTDPDLFDGRMRANVTGCPAYLLKMRDYLSPTDSAATRSITVGSVPTLGTHLATRPNGQDSRDLRGEGLACPKSAEQRLEWQPNLSLRFAAICEAVALSRLHRVIFRHSARTMKGKAPDSVLFQRKTDWDCLRMSSLFTDKVDAVELRNRDNPLVY